MNLILHLVIERIIRLKRAPPEEIRNTSPPALNHSQRMSTEAKPGESYIKRLARTYTQVSGNWGFIRSTTGMI
jgi:hypothetical protein